MKLLSALLLSAVLSIASAYELHIYFDNGAEVRVTGDMGSPCQDLPPQVRDLNVNKITFDKGHMTNEFMVWSSTDCGIYSGQMVKRGGTGTFTIDPVSTVGSIKVV